MGEVDGTGIVLSYLILLTVHCLSKSKCIDALAEWLGQVKQHMKVKLKVMHTDKDLAEVAATQKTCPSAFVNLCYRHARSELSKLP